METTRRALLQLLGLGTAATVTGISPGALDTPAPTGLDELTAALEAGTFESPIPTSLVINQLNIDPYLTPKARTAANNLVKSTEWQYDEPVATREYGDTCETDFVRRKSPCQFLSMTFYNDGLPAGQVPESLVKEWAKMLNEMAERGWEASLAPAGSIQLMSAADVRARHPEYRTDVTIAETVKAQLEGRKLPPPPPLTAEQKRPRVAVFSFVFFRDPEGKLATPAQFNAEFQTEMALLEGEVAANPLEPSSFRWV